MQTESYVSFQPSFDIFFWNYSFLIIIGYFRIKIILWDRL
ncbi:hypothetical protein SAMN05192545_1213 [Maribacter dokdonensis]|uniref:Uncharacterized protein n=1 Tax=Maribacter dokdonensis TaxID=320912 RepID=A0A1H4SW03_9FLAO|nr:hypothetical protein SAMN05192545_1213 [Maribacter dokdonensis]SEC48385.1 hypothetical protein SAMN05192540_3288 [Maribacter dokdonensis]